MKKIITILTLSLAVSSIALAEDPAMAPAAQPNAAPAAAAPGSATEPDANPAMAATKDMKSMKKHKGMHKKAKKQAAY